jgi:predicted Fe-Mo cluster-binding NifX family protein
MIIAITSTGRDLDSSVDERFGRCRYFIFIDPETGEYEAVENECGAGAHGAGVQAAQLLAEKGVSALITGNVGPNAISILREAKIEVDTANSMTVKEAVENYVKGRLVLKNQDGRNLT